LRFDKFTAQAQSKRGRCGFCDRLRSPVAILEAAVFECKKRDIDTPEMREALDFLQPHIRPEWLIQQYRDHVLGHDRTTLVALEGQQQVLRATFPDIRDSVKELIGRMMDALARNFAPTHDMSEG
jgi:hypothetical protein